MTTSYLPSWRTCAGPIYRITRAIVLALTRVGTVGSVQTLRTWFITPRETFIFQLVMTKLQSTMTSFLSLFLLHWQSKKWFHKFNVTYKAPRQPLSQWQAPDTWSQTPPIRKILFLVHLLNYFSSYHFYIYTSPHNWGRSFHHYTLCHTEPRDILGYTCSHQTRGHTWLRSCRDTYGCNLVPRGQVHKLKVRSFKTKFHKKIFLHFEQSCPPKPRPHWHVSGRTQYPCIHASEQTGIHVLPLRLRVYPSQHSVTSLCFSLYSVLISFFIWILYLEHLNWLLTDQQKA